MKYDLFISDFDGTLGKAPDYISAENIAAVKEYVEKGGVFAICTGRMFCSIRDICLRYGIKGIVAAYQGAMIKDIETEKTIFDGGLDEKIAARVIESLLKDGIQVTVDIGDVMYYQTRTEFIDLYEKACSVKGVRVNDLVGLVEMFGKPVSKVMGMCMPETINELTERYNEKFKGEKVAFNSGAAFLFECVNPDCTKDFAVRKIAEYYKIPTDKIIAVGDSTNDIGLLKGEWHGVAVGDGQAELKKIADEITVPFDGNPIAELLHKYCLHQEK